MFLVIRTLKFILAKLKLTFVSVNWVRKICQHPVLGENQSVNWGPWTEHKSRGRTNILIHSLSLSLSLCLSVLELVLLFSPDLRHQNSKYSGLWTPGLSPLVSQFLLQLIENYTICFPYSEAFGLQLSHIKRFPGSSAKMQPIVGSF